MKTVLTIAGFDPSSGAGITADLMVFAAHGLFGTSAITALTVQTPQRVRSTHPVSASILSQTLASLQADLPPAGIKIGMLANATNIHAVCDYLETVSVPIVLDPVLRSTSGRELLDPDGLTAMRQRLLPLVHWITPNLAELTLLAGLQVAARDKLPKASRLLQAQVQASSGSLLGVIATGGHLDPPDDFLLAPSGQEVWLRGNRIDTLATHGTGCAFSSAFLSRLVVGDEAPKAAQMAKLYVAEAMRTPLRLGHTSFLMNHLHPISKSSG